MMLYQDASQHEWVEGQRWDLVVTMDDATNEHYSMFFCDEEGTFNSFRGSFRGVREVIEHRGLFCSLYTDRGSHYWITPKAGGKVDKTNLTQFGRAMKRLGVEMIPAYSPEARGRCERAFRTHQERLPKELAAAGIRDVQAANAYLSTIYLPAFNQEFKRAPQDTNSAFVPCRHLDELDDVLCEHFERVVRRDNCVQFEGLQLQIPPDRHRCHDIKAKVVVRRYADASLSLYHGPRRLARYD